MSVSRSGYNVLNVDLVAVNGVNDYRTSCQVSISGAILVQVGSLSAVTNDSVELGYSVAVLLGLEGVSGQVCIQLVAISICNLRAIINQSSNLNVVNAIGLLGQQANVLNCYSVSPIASSLTRDTLDLGVSYYAQNCIISNQGAVYALVGVVGAIKMSTRRSSRSSSAGVRAIYIIASKVLSNSDVGVEYGVARNVCKLLQLIVAILIGSIGVQLVSQFRIFLLEPSVK